LRPFLAEGLQNGSASLDVETGNPAISIPNYSEE
jgi:hypothetical protein